MRVGVLAGLTLLMAGSAFAQDHQGHQAKSCSVMDAEPPAGLEDWKSEATVTAADGHAGINHAKLALATGSRATLLKTPDVLFGVPPEKPGGSVSYSGIFWFDAPTEGNYTIALSSAAWIDVLEKGKALDPVSFGHGPECSTIRKMVVFALKPGMHVLQVAGSGSDSVKLMVAKKP